MKATRQILGGALGASVMLAGLASVGGCSAGNGAYTSEGMDRATMRVAQMKSATQWDMALQQFLAGDLKKARRSIEKSTALNDQVVKSQVLYGRILIEQGQLEAALDALNTAIAIENTGTDASEYAEAHYYRGIVFERFSQPHKAMEAYEAAMDADPTNVQYPVATAEMMVEQGELDQARWFLEDQEERFENNAAVRQMLGHIAMMQGEFTKASDLFEEATLLGAGDLSLREDLLRAQVALGEFSEAEANLSWILEDPAFQNRRDLQHLRAKCLLKIDRPVEAREILSELVSDRKGANIANLWIDMGNAALVLGDQPRLRDAGQRLMGIAPKAAEGYLFMAMWQRQRNNHEGAISTLYKGMKANPDDPRLAIVQGMVFDDLGNRELSHRAFQMALNRDPGNAQARALLGVMSAGRESAAVAEVDEDVQ